MQIINTTPNGQIFTCGRCDKLHIEFGNLYFLLTRTELNSFAQYIDSVDYTLHLAKNKNMQMRKKLIMKLRFKDVYLALNVNEFLELTDLLSLKKRPQKVSARLIMNDCIYLN